MANDTAVAGSTHIRSALAEVDKALAARPHTDGHIFSVAAHALAAARDDMTLRQRETGSTAETRRRIEHVNAAISVVLGAHFPLGEVPWQELEKARDWLAGLIGDEGDRDG